MTTPARKTNNGRWAHKVKPIPKEERSPRMTENPKFASSRGQEYKIIKDTIGFWKIKRVGGGLMPPEIAGLYQKESLAEVALVKYLKRVSSSIGIIIPDKYR